MKRRRTTQRSQRSQSSFLKNKTLRSLRSLCLIVVFAISVVTVNAQRPVFRSGTELVLVNVVVRDKNGNVVRGLTRDDFAVTEDEKPQIITSFDFEELDKADVAERNVATAPEPQTILPQRPAARPSDATAVKQSAKD